MLESYSEIEVKEPKKTKHSTKISAKNVKPPKIPVGKSKALGNEKVRLSVESTDNPETKVIKKDVMVIDTDIKKSEPKEKSKLKTIFTSSSTYKKLFVLFVALTSIYLIVAPILPALEYYVRDFLDLDYNESIASKISRNDDSKVDLGGGGSIADGTDGDRVLIPKIGVDMAIVKGQNEDALDLGSWIRPNASTPDKGGNTVLTAHRFNYIGGDRSFYNLDKLTEGDEVIVVWKGDEYKYIVEKNFVVEPTQLEVEASSRSPMLTLYTCTPLWTASKRLVVTAKPDVATLELIQSR